MSSEKKDLDVICMGRAAVDLYASDVGARLEDAQTFKKYLGGSSANMAFGMARLGLKSGLISRLGEEQMGQYVYETVSGVGVNLEQIQWDSHRLTGLVLLGIKDQSAFPLLFYRENVSDMAINPEQIDEAYIARAKIVVFTGTHFSTKQMSEACWKVMDMAEKYGTKIGVDIDYRPVLWGLTARGEGDNRYVGDDNVSGHLQKMLSRCDLIVGTEEEIHIAGGAADTIKALKTLRQVTQAELVVKRGPLGCSVFQGDIPDHIDQAQLYGGVRVEVLNVLGAGDAFISGYMKGWVNDESPEQCSAYANACGAIVVSRHGCAPAIPTLLELNYFMANREAIARPDQDEHLNYLHRATASTRSWPELCVLAFDHRKQFVEMARDCGAALDCIEPLKKLIYQTADQVAEAEQLGSRAGILVDSEFGQSVLNAATGSGCWIGRPVEQPASRPLAFQAGDVAAIQLETWPQEHTIKCLVIYHPDDDTHLRLQQEKEIQALYKAACHSGHELLLELIVPKGLPVDDETYARAMSRFYHLGVYPHWWKLPGQSQAAWVQIDDVITRYAPECRGVVLLGLDAPLRALQLQFQAAQVSQWVRGFMVGRTIFGAAARDWLSGTIDDAGLIKAVADQYTAVIHAWQRARSAQGELTQSQRTQSEPV
jgi:5-dehydro-2-deoxygluconokinase